MLSANPTIQKEELLSYVIASGDMRFIGVGERVLFLYLDPEYGQVIHGEIPGCGPACQANLSHILLEYVMSCGDCRDAEFAAQAADRFGVQLGHRLVDACFRDTAVFPETAALIEATCIILNSMNASFRLTITDIQLQFILEQCPLHTTAAKTGLNLSVPLAYRAFISLIETIAQALAPAWLLHIPAKQETSMPIQEICLRKFQRDV